MKSVMQSFLRRSFSQRENSSQAKQQADLEEEEEDVEDFSEPKRVTEIYDYEDDDQDEQLEKEEEDADLRLTVLRNFACPFAAESTCRFEETPTSCPFGHRSTAPVSVSALLTIPDYVCIYHLLGRCSARRKRVQVLQAGSGSAISASGLTAKRKFKLHLPGCTSAIHLRLTTLLDLERFELAYAPVIAEYYNDDDRVLRKAKKAAISSKKKVEGVSTNRNNLEGDDRFTCGICLERVRSSRLKERRQFALLERCDHVFCGPCMLAHRKSGGVSDLLPDGSKRPPSTAQESCPMCRVPSRRLILSERFLAGSSEEKRKLFASFHCQCCL